MTLKSGRVLRFIHAPYLHAPGAIITYDEKSKILFSGDIFGAYDKPEEWNLYASPEYSSRLNVFMEFHMPSKEIVTHTLKKLDEMDIEMIAPQHGSIIRPKSEIKKHIEILKTLNYGSYMK